MGSGLETLTLPALNALVDRGLTDRVRVQRATQVRRALEAGPDGFRIWLQDLLERHSTDGHIRIRWECGEPGGCGS